MSVTLRFALFALLTIVFTGCSAGAGPGTMLTNVDSGQATGVDSGTDRAPTPTGEVCGNGEDDNGDGIIDEMCPCNAGDRQGCWTGSSTRRGVGSCRDGAQACEPFGEFMAWGSCVGESLPAAEIEGNGIDEDCDGGDGGRTCSAREFGEACASGGDDDCDGLVDCADPDCASEPHCSAGCVPAELGELCADGIDNDCDGVVDCLDPDCASHESCAPPPPPPPGCTREFPFFVEVACGDGRDNDCDGDIDCADSDCISPGNCGCDYEESACSDGMDNDCDGGADCSDLDCQQCAPGSYRICDEPMYCRWGRQECGSDSRWGTCVEISDGPGSCSTTLYSATCCVDAGECCQNYPVDDTSIGMCETRVTCLP